MDKTKERIRNELLNSLIKKQRILSRIKKLLILLDKVTYDFDNNKLQFFTQSRLLKKHLGDETIRLLKYDKITQWDDEYILKAIHNEKEYLFRSQNNYVKEIKEINQMLKENELITGKGKIRSIKWLSSLSKIELFYQILKKNELLWKCNKNTFLSKFDFEDQTNNFRTASERNKKIQWLGLEDELVSLFINLSKNGYILKNFFTSANAGLKVLEGIFINKDGNPFKNTQLAKARQNSLTTESKKLLDTIILSLNTSS